MVFWRSIHYIRVGSGVASFPLTLLTFLTVIYDSTSMIQSFFGSFSSFVGWMLPFLALSLGVWGWYWLKKSPFFKQEIEIGVEVNQYQTNKLPPVGIPTALAVKLLLDNHNLKCPELNELLERSTK